MTGQRLGSRFCDALYLVVSGITVIAIAIMGTDPVNPNATFSKTWPDPADFYQIAPLAVLGFLALFTAITAVAALVVVLRRSAQERLPHDDARPVILLAVAAIVVVLPGLARLLRAGTGIELPLGAADLFAFCSLIAAGLGWYAARVAGDRNLGRASAASSWQDDDEDPHRDRYRGYETGEFDRLGSARTRARDGGRDDGRDDLADGYGSRRGASDQVRFADSDIRYPVVRLPPLAADPDEPPDPADGLYREQERRSEEYQRHDEPGRFDEPRRFRPPGTLQRARPL